LEVAILLSRVTGAFALPRTWSASGSDLAGGSGRSRGSGSVGRGDRSVRFDRSLGVGEAASGIGAVAALDGCFERKSIAPNSDREQEHDAE
jgi:hypothetical protein